MSRKKSKRKCAVMNRFVGEQSLRPLPEVRREMWRRHGIKVGRARLWQILKRAEQKIREALAQEA
jgi:hypothetical protein